MTAKEARDLVKHRYDKVILNLEEKIQITALQGHYKMQDIVRPGCFSIEDMVPYLLNYFTTQGFNCSYDNGTIFISWELEE